MNASPVNNQHCQSESNMDAAINLCSYKSLCHLNELALPAISALSSVTASDGFGLTPASRCSENGARVRPKRLSSFLDSSSKFSFTAHP